MERGKHYTKEQLIGYLQDRLNSEDVDRLLSHLTECDSCRNELERLRRIASLLREEESIVGKKKILSKGWMQVAAILGGLLLIAGGGYYFHYKGNFRYPIEQPVPPIYHTGDTMKTDSDSLKIDSIRKKNEQR